MSTLPQKQALAITSECRSLVQMHFGHVEQQVALAATTASLIVAADALLIGAYLTIVKDFNVFQELGTSLESTLFIWGGIFLLIGFICALVAILPNIAFRISNNTPVESAFFFGTIGADSFNKYIERLNSLKTLEDLDREIAIQVWGKSRWLVLIFRFIQVAIIFTIVGTIWNVVLLWQLAPILTR